MWLSQKQCSNGGCISKRQKKNFFLSHHHISSNFLMYEKKSDFILEKSFYLTGNYIISSNHRTY